MPQPEHTWASKAYFARTCQACGDEFKCSPPPGYAEGKAQITRAYELRKCRKCGSEAFDFGSNRHARDCDCWYCTTDEEW